MEVMYMYTVFEHPKDYPKDYVVRKFIIKPGEDPIPAELVIKHESLTFINEFMAANGFCFLHRDMQDDPCILGVWL